MASRGVLKGATYPGFDQHILVVVFPKFSHVFCGRDLRKKIIVKLENGPKKEIEESNTVIHVVFFGRVFTEIFEFLMFVLCFCGGET